MDRLTGGLILVAVALGVLAARDARRPSSRAEMPHPQTSGAQGPARPAAGGDPGMVVLRPEPIDNGMIVRSPFGGDNGMVRGPKQER